MCIGMNTLAQEVIESSHWRFYATRCAGRLVLFWSDLQWKEHYQHDSPLQWLYVVFLNGVLQFHLRKQRVQSPELFENELPFGFAYGKVSVTSRISNAPALRSLAGVCLESSPN